MKRLIDNGDVILNGTQTRHQAEKQAFKKLEEIEEILESYNIDSLLELRKILFNYTQILDIKDYCEREKKLRYGTNKD